MKSHLTQRLRQASRTIVTRGRNYEARNGHSGPSESKVRTKPLGISRRSSRRGESNRSEGTSYLPLQTQTDEVGDDVEDVEGQYTY